MLVKNIKGYRMIEKMKICKKLVKNAAKIAFHEKNIPTKSVSIECFSHSSHHHHPLAGQQFFLPVFPSKLKNLIIIFYWVPTKKPLPPPEGCRVPCRHGTLCSEKCTFCCTTIGTHFNPYSVERERESFVVWKEIKIGCFKK